MGLSKYEVTSWDLKKPPMVLFNGVRVDRLKIKDYFTEYYYSAVQVYNRFKRYGLPYAGGWAEQPEHIIQVLDIFESTIDAYNNHEREKQAKKAQAKRKK